MNPALGQVKRRGARTATVLQDRPLFSRPEDQIQITAPTRFRNRVEFLGRAPAAVSEDLIVKFFLALFSVLTLVSHTGFLECCCVFAATREIRPRP
jgi:hypothetical protein